MISKRWGLSWWEAIEWGVWYNKGCPLSKWGRICRGAVPCMENVRKCCILVHFSYSFRLSCEMDKHWGGRSGVETYFGWLSLYAFPYFNHRVKTKPARKRLIGQRWFRLNAFIVQTASGRGWWKFTAGPALTGGARRAVSYFGRLAGRTRCCL